MLRCTIAFTAGFLGFLRDDPGPFYIHVPMATTGTRLGDKRGAVMDDVDTAHGGGDTVSVEDTAMDEFDIGRVGRVGPDVDETHDVPALAQASRKNVADKA